MAAIPIPESKPEIAAKTAKTVKAEPEEADQAEQASTGAATNGRTLRAVTMRSGPKKGASPIGTIPGKTAVQVLDCDSWCQVVYNGKKGWIYKTYVSRGG